VHGEPHGARRSREARAGKRVEAAVAWQRRDVRRAGRALRVLLSGVEDEAVSEEDVEAAGSLLAELLSLGRNYLSGGKVT
jgi:hypothetical protein